MTMTNTTTLSKTGPGTYALSPTSITTLDGTAAISLDSGLNSGRWVRAYVLESGASVSASGEYYEGHLVPGGALSLPLVDTIASVVVYVSKSAFTSAVPTATPLTLGATNLSSTINVNTVNGAVIAEGSASPTNVTCSTSQIIVVSDATTTTKYDVYFDDATTASQTIEASPATIAIDGQTMVRFTASGASLGSGALPINIRHAEQSVVILDTSVSGVQEAFPAIVQPSASGVVTVVNVAGIFASAWMEGSIPGTSGSVSTAQVSLAPSGTCVLDAVNYDENTQWNTNHQLALHWDMTGDPKVLIRRLPVVTAR